MIDWTQDRCELLVSLWQQKISSGLIATEFKTTRSAICGKIYRLGLSNTRDKTGIKRKQPIPVFRVIKGRKVMAQPIEPLDDNKIPLSSRKTLLELTEYTCRWPVGEPGTDGFFFCGLGVQEGCSYCPSHYERSVDRVKSSKPKAVFVPRRAA